MDYYTTTPEEVFASTYFCNIAYIQNLAIAIYALLSAELTSSNERTRSTGSGFFPRSAHRRRAHLHGICCFLLSRLRSSIQLLAALQSPPPDTHPTVAAIPNVASRFIEDLEDILGRLDQSLDHWDVAYRAGSAYTSVMRMQAWTSRCLMRRRVVGADRSAGLELMLEEEVEGLLVGYRGHYGPNVRAWVGSQGHVAVTWDDAELAWPE